MGRTLNSLAPSVTALAAGRADAMNLRESANPSPVPCFAVLAPTWRNSSKTAS
jgi:hypothetical protein